MFNVESEDELVALNEIARAQRQESSDQLTGQSRRRSANSSLHLDGDEEIEVRRRNQKIGRRLTRKPHHCPTSTWSASIVTSVRS